MEKTCNKCGQSKPFDLFNNRTSSKDGKRTQCRQCENAYSSKWKKENPEKHCFFNKISYKKLMESDKYKKEKAEYWRNKRKQNPAFYNKITQKYAQKMSGTIEFKIRHICSSLLRRGNGSSTLKLIGYTKDQLRQRLEFNFKDGMTWDNYGDWHVDHKKPVNRFLKQGIKDIKLINSLCNLQPLWATDNIKKGCKFG